LNECYGLVAGSPIASGKRVRAVQSIRLFRSDFVYILRLVSLLWAEALKSVPFRTRFFDLVLQLGQRSLELLVVDLVDLVVLFCKEQLLIHSSKLLSEALQFGFEIFVLTDLFFKHWVIF
jgi:hypothetical protein